jgi:hypothetical protein
MAATLTIGELARQADVAATTLRYYERIGLLHSPARIGGQRRYDESILARLEVIRLCKTAGSPWMRSRCCSPTTSQDDPLPEPSPRPNWSRSTLG